MRLMIRNGSRVAPSGDAAANPRRQQLVREGAGALILKECDDSDEDASRSVLSNRDSGGISRRGSLEGLTPSNSL
ncbi:hypothetical protein E4U61_007427 [Claviceps capensis]|nr:hypothetical protein E4U61_007427 [Claviceps capensis]